MNPCCKKEADKVLTKVRQWAETRKLFIESRIKLDGETRRELKVLMFKLKEYLSTYKKKYLGGDWGGKRIKGKKCKEVEK